MEEGEAYREQLGSYRNGLLEQRKESQASYDKGLMTLSAGAIAATIGFYDKLPAGLGMMITAWTCWAFALIAVLGSTAASIHIFDQAIRELDNFIVADDLTKAFEPPKSLWSAICTATAHAAFYLFALGSLIFIFAVSSAKVEQRDQKNNAQQTENQERGEGGSSAAPAPSSRTQP